VRVPATDLEFSPGGYIRSVSRKASRDRVKSEVIARGIIALIVLVIGAIVLGILGGIGVASFVTWLVFVGSTCRRGRSCRAATTSSRR